MSTSINPINSPINSPIGPPVNSSVDFTSTWKQEVNRRVAAHRKSKPTYADVPRESRTEPGSRAAQAAARVAARYANAPSYSEMLASEARAAMLAAEAASRAARAAQAAAQSVLDSLEAAACAAGAPEEDEPASGLDAPGATPARMTGAVTDREDSDIDGRPHAIRWEPELPAQRPAPARPRKPANLFDPEAESGEEAVEEGFAEVEGAQPIPGNLIEFPRQLVATRKVRPRRAEGPLAMGGRNGQLNFFEVDPGAISMGPDVAPAAEPEPAPAWYAPEWSGLQLDAHPEAACAPEAVPEERSAPPMAVASASRRALGAVVDAALVTGAFLTLALLAAGKAAQLPGPHALEIGCGVALVVAGALYEALFFSLARATPGMRYAQLCLCTFEGHAPTRAQRNARLVALLLSVLPLGLGLAWAIFDDEHLTWHDRLSRTYLRGY